MASSFAGSTVSKIASDFQGEELVASAYTLPETNISPENRPLEKEIPIGNHDF